MSTVHTDKIKVEISQNFVAFSEYMNFIAKISFKKLTCSGVILAEGVYSSNLLTKSMASGEVRARKTFCQGCALIWGNLNSV